MTNSDVNGSDPTGLLESEAARRLLSSQRASDRVHRHTEAMLAERYPKMEPESREDDEDMGNTIRVRSPEYHVHYGEKKKPMGKLAKAAMLAAGVGIGGAGVGVPLLWSSLTDRESESRIEERVELREHDYRVGPIEVEPADE